MTTILMIFLLLVFPSVSSYTDQAINLLVRSITTYDINNRYCIELAELPNGAIVNITSFGWHLPYLASTSVDACNITNLNTSLPSSFPSNTMLIIYEHNCTMTEQSWNIEKQFGQEIVLMIITEKTNTLYDLSYNSTAMPVNISVVIFWQNDFVRMSNKYNNPNNIELSIDYPLTTPKKLRPAVLLLFSLVFIILLCGNFWAVDEFRKKIAEQTMGANNQLTSIDTTGSIRILTKQNTVGPNEGRRSKESAVIPMSCCIILLMICFAVAWLLLLYFFPGVMIYILLVMFGISAFSSLTSCLYRLSYIIPFLRCYQIPSHQFNRPCVCQLGPLNLCTIFIVFISLTLAIIWFVNRHQDWIWILQDILGVAVCIRVTSAYRLGNMRVITVILLIFFLYDIFFVFITPFIPIFQKSSTSSNSLPTASSSSSQAISTKSIKNPSVMEQVALGIGTHGETVPLVFALPMFIPESEVNPCVTVQKSMLGFGDIILPGILLTFCKIFDIASGHRWPIYYIQSMIAYFIGLVCTHVALYLMNTAQPALLYIVPCLLLSTIVTSLSRGELKEVYTGRRIQALLDGTTLKVSSRHNVDNSRQGQINAITF